jgi:plastocyanin
VDFRLDVPGDYKLVDHAIGRVVKGAVGTLVATGAANPEVFNPLGDRPGSGGHDMATPTPDGSNGNGNGTDEPDGTVSVGMGDNFFTPAKLTVKASTTVAFELTNQEGPHNMRIADSEAATSRVARWFRGRRSSTPGGAGRSPGKCPRRPGSTTSVATFTRRT